MRGNDPARQPVPGDCRAFTLVELLIATVLVTTSFASLGLGLVQGFDYLQETRDNLRASQIMADQMETIRLYTWDQLNTPSYVPRSLLRSARPGGQGTLFLSTLSITNAPLAEGYSNDVRQVVLDLSWTSKRTQHHRQITTLVSHYGIQNYVYSIK